MKATFVTFGVLGKGLLSQFPDCRAFGVANSVWVFGSVKELNERIREKVARSELLVMTVYQDRLDELAHFLSTLERRPTIILVVSTDLDVRRFHDVVHHYCLEEDVLIRPCHNCGPEFESLLRRYLEQPDGFLQEMQQAAC